MANQARGKKRASGKRKGKNQRREIAGIAMLALGALLFCAAVVPTEAVVVALFRNLLFGLFGSLAYAIPLLIAFIGGLYILSASRVVNPVKQLMSAVFVVALLLFYHLCFCARFDFSLAFNEHLLEAFDYGEQTRLSGGAVAAAAAYPLVKLLDVWGAFILVAAVMLISAVILFNFSIGEVSRDIGSKVMEQIGGIKQRQKERELYVADLKERSEEKRPAPDGPQPLSDAQFARSGAQAEPDAIDFLPNTPDPMPTAQGGKGRISLFRREPKKEGEEQPPASARDKRPPEPEVSREEQMPAAPEAKAVVAPPPEDELRPQIDMRIPPKTATDALEDMHRKREPQFPPPYSLLIDPATKRPAEQEDFQEKGRVLLNTLRSFDIKAELLRITNGPAITRYELQPAPGIKVSRITGLSDDIALSLAARSVRIEAPIPGKAAIGIEIPNAKISTVYLREVIKSEEYQRHPSKISFALGKDVAGRIVIADLARMPHLLIAGATGAGKSVCINAILVSLLYKARPDEVKLIMIDPKVVELTFYNGIAYLLNPVVTDPKKAAGALHKAVREMTRRYQLFAKYGVRDITHFNDEIPGTKGEKPLPRIVIVVDELADLMMVAPKEVEDSICRLAQLARAAGMHLVIATQRPSVNVITGLIKANIPSRISFAVSSQVDSRTILDGAGAEKLLGWGDMLYAPNGAPKPERVQGCFVSEGEVKEIVEFIKAQYRQDEQESWGEIPEDDEDDDADEPDDEDTDELLPQAVEIVLGYGQASISMLQRRLRVGYARAARLIDVMELRGYVSPGEGSKTRNVLISRAEYARAFGKDPETGEQC